MGAIGNPVDLLILRSVLLGGIDGVKITFAPEDWISLLILRRLEGRSTPSGVAIKHGNFIHPVAIGQVAVGLVIGDDHPLRLRQRFKLNGSPTAEVVEHSNGCRRAIL